MGKGEGKGIEVYVSDLSHHGKKMNECRMVNPNKVMLYHENPADCVCGTWEKKKKGWKQDKPWSDG